MPFNELSLYPTRSGKLLNDFEFGAARMALWRTDLRTRLITGNSLREVTTELKRQTAKGWFRKMVSVERRRCIQYMYTLLYLQCITSKDLLCSTGNSAQYYVTT